ncbi:glutamic acid-rich protein-like isoform X2 [Artemia franciscana]|uniref:glutamic acid-rich protein-like isoform X2 n=1 Tax=Artemia franciscana TaxID=6661 RepID=UPI0032DAFD29
MHVYRFLYISASRKLGFIYFCFYCCLALTRKLLDLGLKMEEFRSRRTASPGIPHVAHQRLTPSAAPLRTANTYLDDLELIGPGGKYKTTVSNYDDDLSAPLLQQLTDQTSDLRAQMNSVLAKINDKSHLKGMNNIYTVPGFSGRGERIGTERPGRTGGFADSNILGPMRDVHHNVHNISHYEEPGKRIGIGKSHLACMEFAGGRPVLKRRQKFYDDEKIPLEIKILANIGNKPRHEPRKPIEPESHLRADGYVPWRERLANDLIYVPPVFEKKDPIPDHEPHNPTRNFEAPDENIIITKSKENTKEILDIILTENLIETDAPVLQNGDIEEEIPTKKDKKKKRHSKIENSPLSTETEPLPTDCNTEFKVETEQEAPEEQPAQKEKKKKKHSKVEDPPQATEEPETCAIDSTNGDMGTVNEAKDGYIKEVANSRTKDVESFEGRPVTEEIKSEHYGNIDRESIQDLEDNIQENIPVPHVTVESDLEEIAFDHQNPEGYDEHVRSENEQVFHLDHKFFSSDEGGSPLPVSPLPEDQVEEEPLKENLTEDLDQVQGSANPQSQETENNEEVKEQEACPDVELAEEIITLTDEANAEIEVTEVQHVEEIEEGEVRPSETLTELTDEPGQINSDIIINEDEKEAAEDIHTEVEDKLPESLPSKGAENTNYILENNIENEDE